MSESDALLISEIAHRSRDHAQVSLIVEAVKDAQGTIRAIDTKVGILLAALAIPLPYVVGSISAVQQAGLHRTFGTLFGSLAVALYLLAGFVAIRALIGIGNAGASVKQPQPPPDVFYLGGLYKLKWIDAMFNRRAIASRKDVEEVVAEIPSDTHAMLRVLVSELMILAYIRDVKLFRQKAAFELAASAFVLGILGFLP